MKKIRWVVAMAVAAALCLALAACAAAEEKKEEAEWTVMFYFCGSDLESKYSYATQNLAEIKGVKYPYHVGDLIDGKLDGDVAATIPGKVNVVIETGGSRAWHANELGMDISTNALQRWEYVQTDEYGIKDGDFKLLDTLPLQNMAAPETLADFIRWTAQEYPAKKYALVLWDHGNGAKTGLFIDELFNNDVMYLYEIRQAMADGNVHFEAVIIDACLMANIETAWSIKDYANWMVASEEEVPGKGTAIGEWLQTLVNHPRLDGKWLGRVVCDTTGRKYAHEADAKGKSMLTWSVLDLSKVERLTELFSQFITGINRTIREKPIMMLMYTYCIYQTEEFGSGKQDMRDLTHVLYEDTIAGICDRTLLDDFIETITDTVVYNTRGQARTCAQGLSFCYPADFSDDELEIYARNFPIAPYLAYLDAITSWKAQDWVYEQTERLPEIDTIDDFRVTVQKRISEKGMPALCTPDNVWNLSNVYYELYRLDEATGEVVRLGRTICGFDMTDDNVIMVHASDPMHWPTVQDTLCCIDIVAQSADMILYNIPVQIGMNDTSMLRCGRVIIEDENSRTSVYEIYGVWEGYDENSELPNRNVKPLAMLAGQRFRLLYPKDIPGAGGKTAYAASDELKMYRALDIMEMPLPAGTYYLQYELEDIFMRTCKTERIEIHWDGKNMTFPDGFVWEGEMEPKWTR